jgi:hypothetical protein
LDNLEGEEATCDPVVIAQDAPALDAPDAVLHVDTYGCQSAILCALLFAQVSVSLNNNLQTSNNFALNTHSHQQN